MLETVDANYAKALFAIAKEKNLVSEFQNEIKEIDNILLTEKELFNILKSAFYQIKIKFSLLDKIFVSSPKEIVNFLKILVRNHRINNCHGIFRVFNSLCNEENKIVEGIIYSTYSLPQETISNIEKALIRKYQYGVELNNKIDPNLIGGIKVVIDNHIFDYSITNELNDLRKSLIK